jgi:DNA-directed RNA polymerase sigma subunit (sigma70/sigma32)
MVMIAMSETGHRVGQDHQRSHLTDREIELIRQLRNYPHCMTYQEIGDKFDISKSHARQICLFKRRATSIAGFKSV